LDGSSFEVFTKSRGERHVGQRGGLGESAEEQGRFEARGESEVDPNLKSDKGLVSRASGGVHMIGLWWKKVDGFIKRGKKKSYHSRLNALKKGSAGINVDGLSKRLVVLKRNKGLCACSTSNL